jgi:hypothetical protein
MRQREKVATLIVGLALAAGILISLHFVKHVASSVASAVWGS